MKERVIDGLKKLKEGTDITFVTDYERHTGLSAHELQVKSDQLLTTILHNYGHLNILTIDKFVHRIIRSFSRELGLTTNFELAFDFDEITTRCIEEVLNELGDNQHLTKILIEYYQQLLDQEDNPNIEYALVERAKILNQEEAIDKLNFYKDKDLSYFVETRKKARAKIKELRTKMVSCKQDIETILGSEIHQLKNGRTKAFSSILSELEKKSTPSLFTDSQLSKVQSGDWLSENGKKQNPELVQILNVHGSKLQGLFLDVHLMGQQIIFLKSLDKNIMSFALLNDVQQQLETFKEDNNIVLISELNGIISKIISQESAPYIYEKIGARFENYFIDEFQDTSTLQWQNLIPLIHDSLSSGHENLIVGDAKQSIYRWRGGNAQQFIDLPKVTLDLANLNDINQSFHYSHEGYVLSDNYRSSNAIVEFNNWLFTHLIDSESNEAASAIYSDITQHPKRDIEGLVEVSLVEKKDSQDATPPYAENLLRQIGSCLSDGYDLKDICILVRKNKQGLEIAEFLSDNNFPVTSQDSLLLSQSDEVRLIHAFLKALLKNTNENIIRLFSLFKKKSLIALFEKYRIPTEKNKFYHVGYDFESFLVEEIPTFDKTHFKRLSIYDQVDYLVMTLGFSREDLYLDNLLNAVFDFQQKNGHQTNRFMDFFDEKILTRSVAPPEDSNAIEIMTIHKSKGLQFPVVILPTMISSEKKDAIWLSGGVIEELGLSEINMTPQKAALTPDIKHIQTKSDSLSSIDMINMIYVAYTRAEDRMYIQLHNNRPSSFLKGMMKLIENHPQYSSDSTQLVLGNSTSVSRQTDIRKKNEISISTKTTSNWRSKLIMAMPNSSIDEDHNSFTERNWGLAIHEILQHIRDPKEYTPVLSKFLLKHKGWQIHKEQLTSVLENFAKNQEVQNIYKNSQRIYSERSLGSSSGQILRPDLVIEKEDEIIVVDFKTGETKSKHKQQVLEYGYLLGNIYTKKINMYLIYLSLNSISITHV